MARSTPTPDWTHPFRDLRTASDVVAIVGGLVVRDRLNDHPIVVCAQAAGPPRLAEHLRHVDGTNLRGLGLGSGGWTLNAFTDVTDTHHPLTAAQHLLQSSRVRSVHVITTAYQGLFTGWFGVLCKRRTPATNLNDISPTLQTLSRSGHRHPAYTYPAALLIHDKEVRTTCDHGVAWLRVAGFRRSLLRAAKTPQRPGWMNGARVTFTGVDQRLVASVVPCRRSDVLAVARLTQRERKLVQKLASGASYPVIADHLGCSVQALLKEVVLLEHNRVPGGVPGLLQLVEEGWYSSSGR